MTKSLLIRDVTTLAAFEPAIKLQPISADLDNPYFRDYILTEELADVYARILLSVSGGTWGSTASSLPAERLRSHLISAQYGTGKSYFLTMLSALLAAGHNPLGMQTAKKKFAAFPEMQKVLGKLADHKFLVVQISAEDKGDTSFRELLVHSLIQQVCNVLPDAVFSNEYTEAISHLQTIDDLPIGPALVRVLDEQLGTTPQLLLAKLGRYDRQGLQTYYRAYEIASGHKVSRDVLDVDTTFQDALDLLKPKGYTDIAVLIDELTAYLFASASHHLLPDTLGQLQAFAAHCNKSSSHCLLVSAMHVSMKDFLSERSQQRDYDKVKGRFEEHPFPIYSSKLLAGVFRPHEGAFAQAMRSYARQARHLDELIATFKMMDDGHPMHVSALFPLHPAVAHYLPRIARELGQAERTSFSFINDVVRPKLAEPLGNGRLNLVTLDEVFDYFLPAMEQKEYYHQVIAAWNVVQNKTDNPVAHRAFRVLVLLWVASRARLSTGEARYLDIDLSAEQVADYLNLDDKPAVVEGLDALRESGYVYHNAATKRYFYSHADPGWDLDGEIEKRMAAADANEVLKSELKALGPRVCLNVPDTVTVKVDRAVEAQRLDIEQLKQTTNPRVRAEGKVVFVVPDFAEVDSYKSSFSDVTAKARDLAKWNVMVAVPRRVDMLEARDLQRYRALQKIGQELSVLTQDSVSEHRVMLYGARFSEVQARVQAAIEQFGHPSNFTFYVDGKPCDATDLTEALVHLFERYYSLFPKVSVERINGRSTTNALIENCIVNPECTFSSDTSEVARQARDTLQVLGLCSWKKTVAGFLVELREPEPDDEGYKIWKLALDTLTAGPHDPLATLYAKLGRAPYGLPDYMVELYIAAARALKKIYILDKNNTMPALSKTLMQSISKGKDADYRIIVTKASSVPYTYVCSLWKIIDRPLSLRHYRELERELGKAIDDTRTWLALKADSNNLLDNRFSQVTERLKALDAKSPVFDTLTKHMETIRRILPPSEGYEELAALGADLSGVKVDEDPDAAAAAIDGTIEAVEQFLTESRSLELAHQRYVQLQPLAKAGPLAHVFQAAEEAWQNCSRDVLAQPQRKAFLQRFAKLWQEYARRYVDEHNAVVKAKKAFGEQAEGSMAYAVVAELSQFGFAGLATRSTFDAKIAAVRRQACRPLTIDAMRDYEQFKGIGCTCGYRLGTDVAVLAELREAEGSLTASLSNALDGYLQRLKETLESEAIQVYIEEQASSDDKVTVAGVEDFVAQGLDVPADQYRQLKTLLPGFRAICARAQHYAQEQAKKRAELKRKLEEEQRQRSIPRLPTMELADGVREFLLHSGLEAMTWTELTGQLNGWLQRIAKDLRPPERR